MAKIIRSITSVLLGSYPLGTDGTVQPIEWEVLKQEGNKALLISNNILTTRRFDGKSNVWKNSGIRRWLKNHFMNTAFTDEEKTAILQTKLPDVGTTDKVFLLSYEDVPESRGEAKMLFDVIDYRGWWLRSPGNYGNTALFVNGEYGRVDDYGTYVKEEFGVRPALWVNLDSDIFKS